MRLALCGVSIFSRCFCFFDQTRNAKRLQEYAIKLLRSLRYKEKDYVAVGFFMASDLGEDEATKKRGFLYGIMRAFALLPSEVALHGMEG